MPPTVYNPAAVYNPAQGATYGDMATYLAAKTGLAYHVALNWLLAEGSQQRGNPLGVNYSAKTGPTLYPSWRAGLDAAVANLTQNPLYRAVESAIGGGSPAAERAAIVASPWAPGHYGGGAGFGTTGIPGALTTVDVGSLASPSLSATSDPSAQFAAKLQSIGISSDPAHVITHAEAVLFVQKLYGITGSIATETVATIEGHSVKDLGPGGSAHEQSVNRDPLTMLADALGGLVPALEGGAVSLVILVGLLALGYVGLRKTIG